MEKLVLFVCVFSSSQLFALANVYYSPDQLFASKLDAVEAKVLHRLEERLDSLEKKLELKFGQQMNAVHRAIIQRWDHLNEKFDKLQTSVVQNTGAYFNSCRNVPSDFSNEFMIRPVGPDSHPFMVYCEQNYLGGGWIVIHRRFNGKLNFTRDWSEYRDSFGELHDEHWLGLEKVHRITSSGKYQLLVVLKNFNGTEKVALYDGFFVEGEPEKYRLTIGPLVEGDVGDSLSFSNGAMFSTYDQDNDQRQYGSCAKMYESGWWFKDCMRANLNGLYRQHDARNSTMNWFGFNNNYVGLKEASMMIREKLSR